MVPRPLPYVAAVAALAIGAIAALAIPACSGARDDGDAAEDDTSEGAYTATGSCDGLPRLDLKTPPGVCVGLVASGMTFPRSVAQLASGDLVVTDMGGWAKDRGGVWLLHRKPDKTFDKTKLLTLIDKPSGVAIGPDGLVYVGTPKNIFRFDPNQKPKPRLTVVVDNLPDDGRHPLKHFVFDPKNPWTLYVNVGSGSDECETNGAYPVPCPEEGTRAGIRKYVLAGPSHLATSYTTIAKGLRNSMALAVHPASGLLLQGENSRDSINKHAPSLTDDEGELPHEELNVIDPNAAAPSHHGWPYCYDNGVAAPEYPHVDCSQYTPPALLLPGHVAPLGMEYYEGSMLPAAYRGNLIVGFHGYRDYGHRIVMVPVDARGVPNGEPLDLVRGWDKTATNPQGAPVDVTVAKDGSIYVAEDKNGTVLRIFYDANKGDGAPLKPIPPKPHVASPEEKQRCDALAGKSAAFATIERDVIDTSCVSCHGGGPGYPGSLALLKCDDRGNAQRLLANRKTGGPLVVPHDLNSELVLRLKGQGFPQMPAGGISPEGMDEVLDWISQGAPVP